MKLSLINVIKFMNNMIDNDRDGEHGSMNLAITDGKNVICTRYLNHSVDEPPSLYLFLENRNHGNAIGRQLECIIASEPLYHSDDGWSFIPKNSIITIEYKQEPVIENIDEIIKKISNEQLPPRPAWWKRSFWTHFGWY